jgi:FlaA1/EpsC-like NDP-sugar epimerase
MRPGEKLFEEISTMLEDTVPTSHEKVRIFVGTGLPEANMMVWLEELREVCETRDLGRLVLALKDLVLDYSPSADLLRRIIQTQDRQIEAGLGL